MPINDTPSLPVLAPMSAPEAYAFMLPEISAMQENELVHINLDVPQVVTTVLGSLPEIRALRARILAELPSFDIERFDKLEVEARALSHSHALYVGANRPAMSLQQTVEAATELRDTLHSDAMALCKRGLLDAAQFKEVKRSVGHRDLGVDLQVLAANMRAAWATIGSKTAVSLDELDQAVHLADRLQDAVGLRDQGPPSIAETAAIRHRAFSLLVRDYNEARRAVSYLRWHEEDVESIAPSLFAGRNTARRRSEQEPEAPQAPAAPAAAPAAPVNGGSNAPAAPAGFMGASPFVRG